MRLPCWRQKYHLPAHRPAIYLFRRWRQPHKQTPHWKSRRTHLNWNKTQLLLQFHVEKHSLPDIEIIAKNQKVLMAINGIGRQVKNTVTKRNSFLKTYVLTKAIIWLLKMEYLPQTSLRAPIKGALRKLRIPFMPMISPFMRNVWSGNVDFKTDIRGMVSRPHAKNSKKITTKAWYSEGLPMPEVWKQNVSVKY